MATAAGFESSAAISETPLPDPNTEWSIWLAFPPVPIEGHILHTHPQAGRKRYLLITKKSNVADTLTKRARVDQSVIGQDLKLEKSTSSDFLATSGQKLHKLLEQEFALNK
ncbi:hypothetical protein Ancab_004386 [Ancistrocladus abbreviatus]